MIPSVRPLITRRDLGTHVQSERAAIRAEVTMLAEQLDRAA
jgi:flagellin-like hook-associated protein FlgL